MKIFDINYDISYLYKISFLVTELLLKLLN